MAATQQIKVWANSSLKARVAELAYQQRKTISGVVRDELRSLVAATPEQIAKLKQPIGFNYAEPIVALVNRELWAQSMQKAHASGITIPEYFRAHIEESLSKYGI